MKGLCWKKFICWFPITPWMTEWNIIQRNLLGKVFPKETERLYLSSIYPLISRVALLIKQSHHVVGVTTLMGADDQS